MLFRVFLIKIRLFVERNKIRNLSIQKQATSLCRREETNRSRSRIKVSRIGQEIFKEEFA